MNTSDRLDAMRAEAMRRVDRAERDFRVMFVLAALVEGATLACFLLMMNFRDPLHRLLLAHAVLVYGTLAIGLVALGAYVRQSVLRVLQAVQSLGESGQD
jgi:hypothetical protein